MTTDAVTSAADIGALRRPRQETARPGLDLCDQAAAVNLERKDVIDVRPEHLGGEIVVALDTQRPAVLSLLVVVDQGIAGEQREDLAAARPYCVKRASRLLAGRNVAERKLIHPALTAQEQADPVNEEPGVE